MRARLNDLRRGHLHHAGGQVQYPAVAMFYDSIHDEWGAEDNPTNRKPDGYLVPSIAFPGEYDVDTTATSGLALFFNGSNVEVEDPAA